MRFEDELKSWAEDERNADAPSPEEAAALVARAGRSSLGWLNIAVPALAALVLLAVLWPSPQASDLPEVAAAPPAEPAPTELAKTLLEIGENDIGGDRFTLAANSQAELVDHAPPPKSPYAAAPSPSPPPSATPARA